MFKHNNGASALYDVFHFNEYHEDMIYDLSEIIAERLMLFKENTDTFEQERAHSHLRNLVPFSKKPVNHNRMYIISGIECVVFACAKVTDSFLEDFLGTWNYDIKFSEPMPINDLNPNLVSTLYVYKNKQMLHVWDMYPAYLAAMIHRLHDKNNVIL